MRAVIVQHEEHEGPGLLAPALEACGFQLVRRFRTVQREDVLAELVVVMGGTMGVYEADRHPFLGAELAMLSERLSLQRPCLGVCLGAQLLARAAGADVFRGKNGFERGVGSVRWTPAGLVDPVIVGVRPKTTVAHWHQDTYSPVPGGTLLASSDRYTQQAFRLGPSYGFQFHLELTAAEFGRWLEEEPPELSAQLPKLKAAEPELRASVERLAHHFARTAREMAPTG